MGARTAICGVAMLLLGCSNTFSAPPSGAGGSTGAQGGQAAGGGDGGGGATASAGGDGGGPICAPRTGACAECQLDKCNPTYCTCEANPACKSMRDCMAGCGGAEACIDDCIERDPGGFPDYVLLLECTGNTCPTECPGVFTSPCGGCVARECASELVACLSQAACLSLLQCYDGCAPMDMACRATCEATNSGGVALGAMLFACAGMRCTTECTDNP